mgnify:CR=1 FL=1
MGVYVWVNGGGGACVCGGGAVGSYLSKVWLPGKAAACQVAAVFAEQAATVPTTHNRNTIVTALPVWDGVP